MSILTPFLSITLISLGLSATITIIYRVLTKPDEMRKMKDDTKFYKEKMNQAKKAGDMAKMNEYASEMLKVNQTQLRMSMRPMMATMLLFFLLLGWLNTNFGGITADFSGDNSPTFDYNGQSHAMTYQNDSTSFTVGVDLNDNGAFSQDETFSSGDVFGLGGVYWRPVQATSGFMLFQAPQAMTVHFEMLIAKAPFEIPFIGSYLTWFWWYIFISLPATFILRKVLGVE